MGVETTTPEKCDILLTIDVDMKESLRRIAATRRTSVRATAAWLLAHSIDWYESLSRDDRESA